MGKRRELDWYKPFLQALREGEYVIDACQLVGVPRRTAYNHRKRNQSFGERWQRAAQRGMLARARRSAQLAYCRRILNDDWPLMRRAVHELRGQGLLGDKELYTNRDARGRFVRKTWSWKKTYNPEWFRHYCCAQGILIQNHAHRMAQNATIGRHFEAKTEGEFRQRQAAFEEHYEAAMRDLDTLAG